MPEGSHGRWEPELDADERTMLTGFLDYHRATLRWKVCGREAIDGETGE